MYLSLLGKLSLWSVIPNASSLGKSGRDEAGRCIARTSLYRYVLFLSRLYIFIVADSDECDWKVDLLDVCGNDARDYGTGWYDCNTDMFR